MRSWQQAGNFPPANLDPSNACQKSNCIDLENDAMWDDRNTYFDGLKIDAEKFFRLYEPAKISMRACA